MTYQLTAEIRNQTGKGVARQLRLGGRIPGVCYGKAVSSFGVIVDPSQLDRLLRTSPQGRNTIIELETDTGGRHHVMVQEIQRDPVRRDPLHVDFRVVEDDDFVVVSVPVRRVGRSKAEEAGGRLETARRRVDVRCKVKDIPDAIVFDVSHLRLGDKVRASELAPPEGCTIYFKSDYLVLSVVLPRGAAEEAAEEAGVGAEGEEGSELTE